MCIKIIKEKYRNKSCILGYHTQEFRCDEDSLEEPIPCKRSDAWLGYAYYFWTHIDFAHFWGIDSKCHNTGFYDIYTAYIEEANLIDTVFNEEGYVFFMEKVEKAINHFKIKGVSEHHLEKVNRFLAENFWKKLDIKGIIFQDIPLNKKDGSGRIYSKIPPLHYVKRIQIAVFDISIINNFTLHLEEQN